MCSNQSLHDIDITINLLTPFNENDCFVFAVQGALVHDNLVTLLRTTWKPKQMSEIQIILKRIHNHFLI